MHRFTTVILILSLLSIAASCAFSSVKRPQINEIESAIIRERTFNSTNHDLLEIAKESIEAIGYEILAYNNKIDLVTSKTLTIPIENNCDCGSWNGRPVLGTADFKMKVTRSTINKTSSKISINLRFGCTFTGRNIYGAPTRIEQYQCASKSKIEKEFWEIFNKLIAKE